MTCLKSYYVDDYFYVKKSGIKSVMTVVLHIQSVKVKAIV